MKKAVETTAVQTKREGKKRRLKRGLAWLLSLCLIFTLCPVGRADTVEELTAQLDAVRTELASVKSQLDKDYPNCVSVNGQIVSTNPLVVKVWRLMYYDYYVVKNPVSDGYYLFGTSYSCYHKLTNNTTVVYDEGVAHNATVVGTGYPKGKELNYRRQELERQEAELDSKLEVEKRLAPILERSKMINGHLESLMCVRQEGVRLIFKVGCPFMMICGEKRASKSEGTAQKIDGKQVFDRESIYGPKLNDYGAFIEDENLNAMPVVINGSTMVPVRPLIEWLGGTVNWDSQTNDISCQLEGTSIKMTIGSATAYVNGEAKEMPVPVTVYGGKTVIPLRFVSENLGRRVEWIQDGQYIQVYDKEGAIPSPDTEVPQKPQWDWSAFAGDWVCEEEQYHLYIPNAGNTQTAEGKFRCDKTGADGEYSISFSLRGDGTVYGRGGFDFVLVDCTLQPSGGGLSGTVGFPEPSAVKTVHFVSKDQSRQEGTVTPAPAEGKQNAAWDWDDFVGKWVSEDGAYRVYVPDGGNSMYAEEGSFWNGELDRDELIRMDFIFYEDGSIWGDSYDSNGVPNSDWMVHLRSVNGVIEGSVCDTRDGYSEVTVRFKPAGN